MIFEPINYHPYRDASIYGILGDLALIALLFVISYFVSVISSKRNPGKSSVEPEEENSEDSSDATIAFIVLFVIVPFIIIFSTTSFKASWDNGDHLQYNVRHKYDIQGMTHVDRGFSEARTDQQRMEITSKGKTRFVWLVQNDKTSEPTLLDYDSRKPIEDLLRKP